jgi:hypothetical protein
MIELTHILRYRDISIVKNLKGIFYCGAVILSLTFICLILKSLPIYNILWLSKTIDFLYNSVVFNTFVRYYILMYLPFSVSALINFKKVIFHSLKVK